MKVEADDVTVLIDGRDVVRRARLVCPPGTMTALVGPSGSGKTTLLHCLGLLQPSTSGRVLMDGTDATAWKSSRRRRFWKDHAAFVLQDHGVMEEESVSFNVTMSSSPFGGRVRGDRQRMHAALEEVGLSGRASEPASHLSGGESSGSPSLAPYTRTRVSSTSMSQLPPWTRTTAHWSSSCSPPEPARAARSWSRPTTTR